jgi:hypothetical protein
MDWLAKPRYLREEWGFLRIGRLDGYLVGEDNYVTVK